MTNSSYVIECQRTNVTPKAFFNYCRKRCEKYGLDIESWIDFDNWSNPIQKEEYQRYEHKDWDKPQTEIIKYMPFDVQMYLQGAYNFIMEFDFWDDKKGFGYFFAVEV